MKVYEREKMIQERGEIIGEKRGEKKGEIQERAKMIRNMKKAMSVEQVSEVTGLKLADVEKIFDVLGKYPKESDKEIASRLILEEEVGEENGTVEERATLEIDKT